MGLFRQLFYEETSSDIKTIKDSIKNRNSILFYYEGDDKIERGYRWVEPVAFGYSKDGNGLLRAFQTKEKPSKSKHKPMWRLFRTDKISKISKSLKKFNKPRKGYNPNGDRTMATVEINAKFK
jgi:predicted DNA-binding transcriptional regulator YafY